MDDFKVSPRSAKQIEALTLAWRDTFGVANDWAPNIVCLMENELPKLPKYFRDYSFVVRPDSEMGEAEAYTEFDPPHVAVKNLVYQQARKGHGRSRMTFAHELGHLVMHPGAAKLRSDPGVHVLRIKPFESAEWQANKFASLFLMPTHIIREFGSASQIAECCQVSLRAAQIRFSELPKDEKSLPDCIIAALES